MQNVNIIGFLGKAPELKQTQAGTKYTINSIAIHDSQDKQKVAWLKIVASGKTAEILTTYCDKGSKVAIEGNLYPNIYTDKNGVSKSEVAVSVTAVTLIAKTGSNATAQSAQPVKAQNTQQNTNSPTEFAGAPFVDDFNRV